MTSVIGSASGMRDPGLRGGIDQVELAGAARQYHRRACRMISVSAMSGPTPRAYGSSSSCSIRWRLLATNCRAAFTVSFFVEVPSSLAATSSASSFRSIIGGAMTGAGTGSQDPPGQAGLASVWFAAGGDEAGFVGDDGELGSVSGVEFHHGPVDVCLGGGWADGQAFSDVVVGQAGGDEGEDLPLAGGEIGERGGGAGRCDVGLGEDPGDQGPGRGG